MLTRNHLSSMNDEYDPTANIDLEKLAGIVDDAPEEVVVCEKCGEPTRTKTVGDEAYDWCPDCNWATHI